MQNLTALSQDAAGKVTASGDLAVTGTLTYGAVSPVTSLEVGGGYGDTGCTIATTGNIQTNGTLTVDGASTLTGNTGVTGDFAVNTNKFTVAASSGNTVVAGTLGVTGIFTGKHRHPSQELTSSGAITVSSGLVLLNHATVVVAATKVAPAAGDELYIINNSASGTTAHTVTLPAGVTWDGTNNTATLDAPGEALHVIAISATRWFILENIGSVALSNV
jgi:hypothetical protein